VAFFPYLCNVSRTAVVAVGGDPGGQDVCGGLRRMKFGLIDSIIELTRGERVVGVKAVSLAEEYLGDHFPTFPVLPGVLMLEALAEAAAWLVRDALDFAPSVILLRVAKNVTYKSFVKPGNLLRLEVTCRRLAEQESEFEGIGYCRGIEVVRARFGLRHFNVDHGQTCGVDERIIADARRRFALLCNVDPVSQTLSSE